jgi:serine/threonine protein phosphatase PrpC
MLTSSLATLHDNSAHGEDSYLIRDLGDGNFLDVVLDGVTGHGGNEASTSVADALRDISIAGPDDIVAVLNEQNEDFFQVGGGRFLLTTFSASLYLNGQLHIVSVGDSPIYVIRPDSHEQFSGRHGGLIRLGVSQAIGAEEKLTVFQTTADITHADRLVSCTDGVSDNLLADELMNIVRGAADADDACGQVSALVNQHIEQGRDIRFRGGRFRHDDETAIFRFFSAG